MISPNVSAHLQIQQSHAVPGTCT